MVGFLVRHVSQKDGAGCIAILSKSLYRRANDIAKAHTSIWGVGIGGTRQIEKGLQPTICKDTNKIGKQTKRSGNFILFVIRVCFSCVARDAAQPLSRPKGLTRRRLYPCAAPFTPEGPPNYLVFLRHFAW